MNVNVVGVSPGKVDRVRVCHIPFHSACGFWQRSWSSARWLEGCQVQSPRLVHPHTLSRTSWRKKLTRVFTWTYCIRHMYRHQFPAWSESSNSWNLLYKPKNDSVSPSMMCRTLAGLHEVVLPPLVECLAPAGYNSSGSFCSAAGPTNMSCDIWKEFWCCDI